MKETQNEWRNCPVGEISGMVERSRTARRRATARRVASAWIFMVVATISAVWAIQGVLPGGADSLHGGLTCKQVKGLMAAHHKGSLAPQVEQNVSLHLRNCPGCRAHYESIYDRRKSTTEPTTRRAMNSTVAAVTFRP